MLRTQIRTRDDGRLQEQTRTGCTWRELRAGTRRCQGFVVMQLGNDEMESVFEQAIAPAFEACGLEPRRSDLNTQGGLIQSEVIAGLEEARIIVADLTNERPNC